MLRGLGNYRREVLLRAAAVGRRPQRRLPGIGTEHAMKLRRSVVNGGFLVKGRIETAGLLRAIRYATQRMKAEVEMQKTQEEAEAANRVKR